MRRGKHRPRISIKSALFRLRRFFLFAPAFDQRAFGVAEGVSEIGRKRAGPERYVREGLALAQLIRRLLAADEAKIFDLLVRFRLGLAVMPLSGDLLQDARIESVFARNPV
jgi:hypothetical protein